MLTPTSGTPEISSAPTTKAKGFFSRLAAWWNDPVENLCILCNGAMRPAPAADLKDLPAHFEVAHERCECCGGFTGHPLGTASVRRSRR